MMEILGAVVCVAILALHMGYGAFLMVEGILAEMNS